MADTIAEEQPVKEMRTRTQVLLLLALATVLVVALGGAAVAAWSAAWQAGTTRNEWGTCHALAWPPQCSGVSMSSLERFSGLTFPAGSRIVSSSTGPDLFGNGQIHATVVLPAHAVSPLAGLSRTDGSPTIFYNDNAQVTQSTNPNAQTVLHLTISVVNDLAK